MTENEKQYFYQKKRALYLQSVHMCYSYEHRFSKMCANEVLRLYKKFDKAKIMPIILDGNEFRDRPPTRTGEEACANNILQVMLKVEYMTMQINEKKEKTPYDDILKKHGLRILKLIKEMLKVYFRASGVRQDNEKDSEDDRRLIEDNYDKLCNQYEADIKKIMGKVLDDIIISIKDNYGIKTEETSESTPNIEILKLKSLNPEKYIDLREKIDTITNKVQQAENKISQLEQETESVLKALNQEISGKEESSIIYHILSRVLKKYPEIQQSKKQAYQVEVEAGIMCIDYLLSGKTAGPVEAKMIKELFGVDLPAFSDQMQLFELPGYCDVSVIDTSDISVSCDNLEDFRRVLAELLEYKKNHYNQFENQTILSVCTNNGELPKIASKAKLFVSSIIHFINSDELGKLNSDEQKELLDIWIEGQAIFRTAICALEFSRINAEENLQKITQTRGLELAEMNYNEQLKICRKTLPKVFANKLSKKG